jgi:hypothetical protein
MLWENTAACFTVTVTSQHMAEHAEENLEASCSELWVSGSGQELSA